LLILSHEPPILREQVFTPALVVSHLVYGDNAIIVQLFTREKGLVAVMVKGLQSKSKGRQVLLQALSPININLQIKEHSEIQSIKEPVLVWSPIRTWTELPRSTVAMFMAEVLFKTLHKGYVNKRLFDDCFNLVENLETADKIALLPAVFLHTLCLHYGFDLDIPEDAGHKEYAFDPTNALFLTNMTAGCYGPDITRQLFQFKKLAVPDILDLPINASQRNLLTRALLTYLLAQLDENRKVSSHLILESVFHD
jgi:DNA repair protein RecO